MNKAFATTAPNRWLEVVSHLDPKYGGLSSAVPALSAAVAQLPGQEVSIAAFCLKGENFVPAEASQVALQHLAMEGGLLRRSRSNLAPFRQLIANAQAVHIHGLWERSTVRAAWLAQELGRPYMISAHGMLERWALQQKRWKKTAYAALIERPLLRRAACLHALTEAEAEDYRRFGLRNPVAVIPNGVTVNSQATAGPFLDQFPQLKGKRLLLFLGRLHWKKGVHVLCEAWAQMEKLWPDVHLVMAGPDSGHTRNDLEDICSRQSATRVTFTGMLQGELKWSALRAASVFLLPSYSEGLSVSVLEAMGMGLPVLVSPQCHLPEVTKWACGWEVKTELAPLVEGLNECLRTPEARRAALGQNGRELVARRYNWPRIGREMASVYAWLNGGEQPKELFVDQPQQKNTHSAQEAAWS